MVVITGATGNTGRPICEELLDAEVPIRVLTREASKAADLKEKGAEVMEGSWNDKAFLKKAFDGADGVYAMIPPAMESENYYKFQKEYADAMAAALKACKVPSVVSLSSIGAQLESGNGVVKGLHYMEEQFNAIEGLHCLHLRPAYFMENLLAQIGNIKQQGMIISPLKGNLRFPMVSVGDIAMVAAVELEECDFDGNNVREILGAENASMTEVANVIGNALGMDELQYQQIPTDQFIEYMSTEGGTSQDFAIQMAEYVEGMNQATVFKGVKRTMTNSTPTSIEDWVEDVFVPAYNAS